MLSDFAKILVPALVAAIVAGAMFATWVANRKRIAADSDDAARDDVRAIPGHAVVAP